MSCAVEHQLANGTWLRIAERQTPGGGIVGFRVDISDLKKIEEELRLANESLEERVRSRTREIEQLHGRILLQDKMASIGQLAAGIAHELYNPVNFVRTNFAALSDDFADILEILQDYREITESGGGGDRANRIAAIRDKEQTLQLAYILEDIPTLFQESKLGFESIISIIESMLVFSRTTRDAEYVEFDINQSIENTLVISKNTWKYHAKVQTDLSPLPLVPCLPEQINQVVLNLVVNSAHAIADSPSAGRGLISISTWSQDGHVHCRVADSGPGIPEDIRAKVFEPFFTTKAPGKGTGLGLSISYDIVVNKHQGQMTVACPESGGAAFTFSLPAVRASDG